MVDDIAGDLTGPHTVDLHIALNSLITADRLAELDALVAAQGTNVDTDSVQVTVSADEVEATVDVRAGDVSLTAETEPSSNKTSGSFRKLKVIGRL